MQHLFCCQQTSENYLKGDPVSFWRRDKNFSLQIIDFGKENTRALFCSHPGYLSIYKYNSTHVQPTKRPCVPLPSSRETALPTCAPTAPWPPWPARTSSAAGRTAARPAAARRGTSSGRRRSAPSSGARALPAGPRGRGRLPRGPLPLAAAGGPAGRCRRWC